MTLKILTKTRSWYFFSTHPNIWLTITKTTATSLHPPSGYISRSDTRWWIDDFNLVILQVACMCKKSEHWPLSTHGLCFLSCVRVVVLKFHESTFTVFFFMKTATIINTSVNLYSCLQYNIEQWNTSFSQVCRCAHFQQIYMNRNDGDGLDLKMLLWGSKSGATVSVFLCKLVGQFCEIWFCNCFLRMARNLVFWGWSLAVTWLL